MYVQGKSNSKRRNGTHTNFFDTSKQNAHESSLLKFFRQDKNSNVASKERLYIYEEPIGEYVTH
jgi:hypothetical protein